MIRVCAIVCVFLFASFVSAQDVLPEPDVSEVSFFLVMLARGVFGLLWWLLAVVAALVAVPLGIAAIVIAGRCNSGAPMPRTLIWSGLLPVLMLVLGLMTYHSVTAQVVGYMAQNINVRVLAVELSYGAFLIRFSSFIALVSLVFFTIGVVVHHRASKSPPPLPEDPG